ncbi:MAG: hypothetical protein ACOH5I_05460 [Oligoflexus sp.]
MMRKITLIKLLLPLLAMTLTIDSHGKDTCLGPDKATDAFIYLHGLDDPKVGEHENRNRKLLQKIAEDLNTKIAVPRSKEICRNNRSCWTHQGVDQIMASMEYAMKQSHTCIGDRKLKGMMGFSNGGYLLSKYFQSCKHSNPISYLITGALGELNPIPLPKSPDRCGHLTIAIGRQDQVYRRSKSLYQTLAKKFPGQVKFTEFAGGHDLDEKTLREWLQESRVRYSQLQK